MKKTVLLLCVLTSACTGAYVNPDLTVGYHDGTLQKPPGRHSSPAYKLAWENQQACRAKGLTPRTPQWNRCRASLASAGYVKAKRAWDREVAKARSKPGAIVCDSADGTTICR